MLPASLSARWVSREFVESTAAGGAFTVVAYVLMFWLFVLELKSFLGEAPASELALDGAVDSAKAGLRIHFDIGRLRQGSSSRHGQRDPQACDGVRRGRGGE